MNEMIGRAKGWFEHNQTLVYFLIAQAIAFIGAVITMTSYMATLEARVSTLEIRGSPHLEKVDARLTVLESQMASGKVSIDRIVDVMTKELHIPPTRDK